MVEKGTKKALPESMYFLVDGDYELRGPLNKDDLNSEVEDSSGCYEDMTAFMVSYDGEKLIFQGIDIEEKESFELFISPHKQSL